MAEQALNAGAEILVEKDEMHLGQAVAERIVSRISAAIQARGRAYIALSGGSSPMKLYQSLALNGNIDWQKVTVALVDERFVDPLSTDHNGGAIAKALNLEAGPARACEFLGIETRIESSELAAQEYARTLARLQSDMHSECEWPVFDVVLLGMGDDGHTASLFPDTGAVEIANEFAIAVKPFTAPHERISVSLPVINAARCVIFLIMGAKKAERVQDVVEAKKKEFPASHVHPSRGELLFALDEAAAAALGTLKG